MGVYKKFKGKSLYQTFTRELSFQNIHNFQQLV